AVSSPGRRSRALTSLPPRPSSYLPAETSTSTMALTDPSPRAPSSKNASAGGRIPRLLTGGSASLSIYSTPLAASLPIAPILASFGVRSTRACARKSAAATRSTRGPRTPGVRRRPRRRTPAAPGNDRTRRAWEARGLGEGLSNDLLGLSNDPLEVIGAVERLGVDLVDVLRARRARGE